MQSPFAIFRKNAKVMTIVLTGLAMFAFVVLGSIDQMPGLFAPVMGFVVGAALFWALSGKSGVEGGAIAGVGGIIGVLLMVFIAPRFFGPKPEFVLNGKKITATEVNQLVNQRKIANQFIEFASTAVRAQVKKDSVEFAKLNRPPFFGYYDQSAIRKDVMIGYLLNLKADEMGVTISNDVVTDFINKEVTTNHLSKKQLVQVLRKLRISEKQLYGHLRRELRARFILNTLSPTSNPVMPEELWEMFRKVEVTQAMDVIPFEVESFVDTSQNPEKGKLEEFFKKYKDRTPNITRIGTPAPGEPGFKQPRRIQIGYFEADNRLIEKKIRKKLEKEIIPEKEVEELKKTLQARLLLFKAGIPGRIDRREINKFEANKQLAEIQSSTDLLVKMLSSPQPVKRLDYLVQEHYEQVKKTNYKTFTPPTQKDLPTEKESPDINKTTLGEEGKKEDVKKEEQKREEKKTTLPPAPETSPKLETKKEVAPEKTPLKEKPSLKTDKKEKMSLKQTEQTTTFVSFLKDEKKPLPIKEETAKEDVKDEKKDEKEKETVAPDTVPSTVAAPSEKENKKETEKKEKAPPKYRPLDEELKGEIEDTLVKQRSQKAVEEQTQKAFEYMSEIRDEYFADVNRARMAALDKKEAENKKNPQGKKAVPEKEEEDVSKPGLTNEERLKLMKEYASKHMLNYVELEPLSGKELGDLAKEDQEISSKELFSGKLNREKYLIGDAIELSSGRTVIRVLFSQKKLWFYSAGRAYDFKNGKQFAYWAIDDIKTHTPQFSDPGIKKKVLKAWRIIQATPIANKRAKEISQRIQEGKLLTPLVDFSMAELREELLSRGMKEDIQGQEMLDWLKKKIADHQDAISDIGDDTDTDQKAPPKKEEPAKETIKKELDKKKTEKIQKKTETPKVAPEKKGKKSDENKKEKTSAISNPSQLQNVIYQEEKPSGKKVEKKNVKKSEVNKTDQNKKNEEKAKKDPKPKVKEPSASSEKKAPPVKKSPKKKVEIDRELLELKLFLDAVYYSTDLDNARFELNDSTTAPELLDWLANRINKSKGDLAKKEQLEKTRTELTLTGKKGSPLLSFKYAGSFSWWIQQGRNGLALSEPVGIEKAGNDFMEYVFEKLKNGETGVITNADHSITYVVTVRKRVDASKEKFMSEATILQSSQSPFSRMILNQQQGLSFEWFTRLMRKSGLNL